MKDTTSLGLGCYPRRNRNKRRISWRSAARIGGRSGDSESGRKRVLRDYSPPAAGRLPRCPTAVRRRDRPRADGRRESPTRRCPRARAVISRDACPPARRDDHARATGAGGVLAVASGYRPPAPAARAPSAMHHRPSRGSTRPSRRSPWTIASTAWSNRCRPRSRSTAGAWRSLMSAANSGAHCRAARRRDPAGGWATRSATRRP